MKPERLEARIQEVRTLLSQIESELSLLEKGMLQASRATATDELTGCMRRKEFLERARTLSDGKAVSVLFMDLDHFKSVNDRYGHAAGDEALRSVGHVLSKYNALPLVSARWGGEEFVLVFQASKSESMMLAECIRSQIEALVFKDGFKLTISIGLASQNGGEIDELIEKADRALYQAKYSGRNRVYLAA